VPVTGGVSPGQMPSGSVSRSSTQRADRVIDGGLGCQADGLSAVDCFGLQPELLLRIAVVPVGDGTLLAWSRGVRDAPTTDEQFADFDRMMASLELR
jgi:hypothetical protein